MNDLKEKIKELTLSFLPEIIGFRRWLHQHPELSFKEYETSRFISQKLDDMGIPYTRGHVGTGIIATFTGISSKGKVIALRADMDALPIEEENELDYKSVNKGIMHACGHDAHVASLLGTALILKELREHWHGTVILIFQPGEEVLPGGASQIINAGDLNNPKPDMIIGQHVFSELECGQVGFRKGIYMASGDEIFISVNGKGGHAAMPHTINDTVFTAAQIIVNLQQNISRTVPATIPTVLSFGKIEANGAVNVIPNVVKIEGTLRTMNEKWRAIIKEKIVSVAESTASSMGCSCSVLIKDGYPTIYNNEDITEKAIKFAKIFLNETNVKEIDLSMTTEDFGYYSQNFPATFYRFGIKNRDYDIGLLHSSRFNLDEASLETSVGLMSWLAINFL